MQKVVHQCNYTENDEIYFIIYKYIYWPKYILLKIWRVELIKIFSKKSDCLIMTAGSP